MLERSVSTAALSHVESLLELTLTVQWGITWMGVV